LDCLLVIVGCFILIWYVLVFVIRYQNELIQIRDGVGIEATNAPTLVEMEVETQLVGGSEQVKLIGGSPNVVVKV